MNNVLMVFGGALLIMCIMSWMILQLGGVTQNRSHETRLLYFAAVILTALGLVFVIGMAMSYWDAASAGHKDGSGTEIFRQCLQVIPPIVTLVLGYFFGRQESIRDSSIYQNNAPPGSTVAPHPSNPSDPGAERPPER